MSREQLKIIEVKDVKPVGSKGAELLAFKAQGKDGKALWYRTFRRSLFDSIKVGATIEADVEVKTEEREGATYTNRQVSQVYIDGQPMAVKGQYQGFRANGRSPEEIASIESQVAAKIMSELVLGGKVAIDSEDGKMLLAWCRAKMALPAKGPTEPVKQVPSDNGSGGASQEQEVEIDMSHIANIGEFLTRAQKHWPELKTKKQIWDKLEVSSEASIADLDVTWEHLVSVMVKA